MKKLIENIQIIENKLEKMNQLGICTKDLKNKLDELIEDRNNIYTELRIDIIITMLNDILNYVQNNELEINSIILLDKKLTQIYNKIISEGE